METDKKMLVKGVKFLFYTIILMFTAPVVLFQAFKNQEHPWFWPVLILGLFLAIAAVSLGFYSIKLFVDALFNKKVQDN
jgi:drug/metabolite transporter (DMT)-like permease